jgi:hypothetical protein
MGKRKKKIFDRPRASVFGSENARKHRKGVKAPIMGVKNVEFSADFKNAKCPYAKCTYKKLFQK